MKSPLAPLVFAVASIASAGPAVAQAAPPPASESQHAISNEELELLRADIRSRKKQMGSTPFSRTVELRH